MLIHIDIVERLDLEADQFHWRQYLALLMQG
jgi:hypothetical protein